MVIRDRNGEARLVVPNWIFHLVGYVAIISAVVWHAVKTEAAFEEADRSNAAMIEQLRGAVCLEDSVLVVNHQDPGLHLFCGRRP